MSLKFELNTSWGIDCCFSTNGADTEDGKMSEREGKHGGNAAFLV